MNVSGGWRVYFLTTCSVRIANVWRAAVALARRSVDCVRITRTPQTPAHAHGIHECQVAPEGVRLLLQMRLKPQRQQLGPVVAIGGEAVTTDQGDGFGVLALLNGKPDTCVEHTVQVIVWRDRRIAQEHRQLLTHAMVRQPNGKLRGQVSTQDGLGGVDTAVNVLPQRPCHLVIRQCSIHRGKRREIPCGDWMRVLFQTLGQQRVGALHITLLQRQRAQEEVVQPRIMACLHGSLQFHLPPRTDFKIERCQGQCFGRKRALVRQFEPRSCFIVDRHVKPRPIPKLAAKHVLLQPAPRHALKNDLMRLGSDMRQLFKERIHVVHIAPGHTIGTLDPLINLLERHVVVGGMHVGRVGNKPFEPLSPLVDRLFANGEGVHLGGRRADLKLRVPPFMFVVLAPRIVHIRVAVGILIVRCREKILLKHTKSCHAPREKLCAIERMFMHHGVSVLPCVGNVRLRWFGNPKEKIMR
eukprot:m.65149 g.65149  ORF g.65149 m.65149 type:complete len:469 (-) comp8269_c0_seq1:975-2381(-)